MKTEELRIGNYVKYRDEWDCEVESLGYTFATHNKDLNDFLYGIRCGSDDIEDYNPIPLDEEWLLKLGFKKGIKYYSFNGFDVDSKGWIGFNNMVADCKIKHVHQLQNLYFALTGQELVIKDGI